jgi:hypothetical protein
MPDCWAKAQKLFPSPGDGTRPTYDDFQRTVFHTAEEELGRNFERWSNGDGAAEYTTQDTRFFRTIVFYAELVGDEVEIFAFDASWYEEGDADRPSPDWP